MHGQAGTWCWSSLLVATAALCLIGAYAQPGTADGCPPQDEGVNSPAASAVEGWTALSSLAATSRGVCAANARQGNAAFCWGRQLDGSTAQLVNVSAPTAVPSGDRSWRALAVGHYSSGAAQPDDSYACGIQADGQLACWGSDFGGVGLLGAGVPRSSAEPLPLAVAGPWEELSVGSGGTACAIQSGDKSLWCWGSNSDGALGCGQLPDALPWTATPCRVNSTTKWLQAAAGLQATCAVSVNQSLWCWGQLGGQLFSSPQRIVESNVRQAAVGRDEACLIYATGAAYCFSTNSTWPPKPVAQPCDYRWRQIAVGATHKCGISPRGQVYCWGQNSDGQCGTGSISANVTIPTPAALVTYKSGISFVAVSAGDRFSCAELELGRIWCWGGATDLTGPSAGYTVGELGDGSFRSSATPVGVDVPMPVPSAQAEAAAPAAGLDATLPSPPTAINKGWSRLASLAAASRSACALNTRAQEGAFCWGRQFDGSAAQLVNVSAPTAVPGSDRSWRALAVGHYSSGAAQPDDSYACGIQADGQLACWGSDFGGVGLLGAGAPRSSAGPLPLAVAGPWEELSVGSGGTACAIQSGDKSLWCWGSNSGGALGCGQLPDAQPWTATPCRADAAEAWLQVAAGRSAACAIDTRGGLWCWGLLGQVARPSPVRVLGDAAQVAVGTNEACVGYRNYTAACFALATWPPQLAPFPSVPGERERLWYHFSLGSAHTCGIELYSRQAYCWGANKWGQCGVGAANPSTLPYPTPVAAPANTSATLVEAGDGFSCVHSDPGEVHCFGGQADAGGYTAGELGDGTFSSSAVPVELAATVDALPVPAPSPSSGSDAPVGAIVGGVLGGLALVAAAAGLAVYMRRRSTRARTQSEALPPTVVTSDASSPAATVGEEARSSDLARTDPLLSWIGSHGLARGPTRAGSRAVPSSSSSAGTARAAVGGSAQSLASSATLLDMWEVPFQELRMQAVIGRGSYGKVYRARLHESDVAVKILLQPGDGEGEQPASLSSPAMASVLKEAAISASIAHPNVVKLIGVCLEPPSLVMEYCSRGSLSDVLRQAGEDAEQGARLSWALRLHMALDAARGLLALHTHSPPILHRDLKSPNLLVDANWRCAVTDFNLSTVVLEGSSAQSTGIPINPRWLAPEILKGARASAASDVFAFACVLWELLTWRVPWADAESFWQIVSAVTRGERLPIPAREDLPGPDTQQFAGLDAYCALMQRCWAQAPADRPGFAEVVQELRRLVEHAAALRLPPSREHLLGS